MYRPRREEPDVRCCAPPGQLRGWGTLGPRWTGGAVRIRGSSSRASRLTYGYNPVNTDPAAQYRVNIDAVPCDNKNRALPPLRGVQQASINRWVLRIRYRREPKRSASC